MSLFAKDIMRICPKPCKQRVLYHLRAVSWPRAIAPDSVNLTCAIVAILNIMALSAFLRTIRLLDCQVSKAQQALHACEASASSASSSQRSVFVSIISLNFSKC